MLENFQNVSVFFCCALPTGWRLEMTLLEKAHVTYCTSVQTVRNQQGRIYFYLFPERPFLLKTWYFFPANLWQQNQVFLMRRGNLQLCLCQQTHVSQTLSFSHPNSFCTFQNSLQLLPYARNAGLSTARFNKTQTLRDVGRDNVTNTH